MAKLRQQGDLQFWVASGKQVLLMRNGLVVRTVGLEPGLDGTRFDGESPFKHGLQNVVEDETNTRWIDMYQGQKVGLAVNSRFSRKGLETVTIMDKPYVLQRIDEEFATGQRLALYVSTDQAHNKDTGFRFAQEGPVNVFYWIDGKFGYALSAGAFKAELARVATAVYDQLEKPGSGIMNRPLYLRRLATFAVAALIWR